MNCNKLVSKDFLQTVTVLGCMVVHRRIRILSPAVPASFEPAEEDEEDGGRGAEWGREREEVGRGRRRRGNKLKDEQGETERGRSKIK